MTASCLGSLFDFLEDSMFLLALSLEFLTSNCRDWVTHFYRQ